jgi:hypothetical protein
MTLNLTGVDKKLLSFDSAVIKQLLNDRADLEVQKNKFRKAIELQSYSAKKRL